MADTIESLKTDVATQTQAIADAEARIVSLNADIEPHRESLRQLIAQRADVANNIRLLKLRQAETQRQLEVLQKVEADAAAKAELDAAAKADQG